MITQRISERTRDMGREASSARLFCLAFLAFTLLLSASRPGSGGETVRSGGGLRPAQETRPVGMPSTLIELDGTSSVSPDGGTLSYEWRQVSGPRIQLSDPRIAKPYFRTGQPGVYEFELVVEANGLKSEPHLVRLEIERENLPPVAKVYPEAWGQVGSLLEIDGRESFDPEGEDLTYRWRALTPGLVIPPAALGKPVLAFEPMQDGVFEVELVVSDGEKVSNPVVCRVSVKPRPKPPVAKVQVKTLKSTLPAGDISAMQPPATLDRDGGNGSGANAPLPPSFDNQAAPGVSPGSGRTGERSAAAAQAMSPLAPLPEVAAQTPVASRQKPVARIEGPAVVKTGDSVMLDARSSWSAGGSRLEYLWRQKSGPFINDFELVFDGGAERFKAPRPGDYEFELVVSEGGVESAPVLHALRVVEEDDAPVAVVMAPTRAMPGALVKMDATGSYDMAGSPLIYRWRQTGGPAVKNYVIDENLGDAAPAFHPPTQGIYSFELIVSNGRRNSKPIEIDIEVGDARLPPTLVIVGPEVATTGQRLFLTASVGDYDPAAFTYLWEQSDGPADALLQWEGPRGLVAPPVPGRYVFDVSIAEAGRVVARNRRVLEVFKGDGAAVAETGLYTLPDPGAMMGQPETFTGGGVQASTQSVAAYGYEPQQRPVVPELAPVSPSVPDPTSFPDPQPARGGKRGRKPAQVLQGGKSR